jgi:hypothetical protein
LFSSAWTFLSRLHTLITALTLPINCSAKCFQDLLLGALSLIYYSPYSFFHHLPLHRQCSLPKGYRLFCTLCYRPRYAHPPIKSHPVQSPHGTTTLPARQPEAPNPPIQGPNKSASTQTVTSRTAVASASSRHPSLPYPTQYPVTTLPSRDLGKKTVSVPATLHTKLAKPATGVSDYLRIYQLRRVRRICSNRLCSS